MTSKGPDSEPKPFATKDTPCGFPMALWDYGEASYGKFGEKPRSISELYIIYISAAIRDKPNWWVKVFDEEILDRWTDDVFDSFVDDVDEDDEDAMDFALSQYKGLFRYAVAETQWIASQLAQRPGEIISRPAAVEGVYCRDEMSTDLLERLVQQVAILRHRPAIGSSQEDRHPGTPQMVDLVHPSLYCYEQGKSMILPNVGSEALRQPDNWDKFLAAGIKEEGKPKEKPSLGVIMGGHYLSADGMQWIPAEFHVNTDGTKCEIGSYINSLHPVQDATLYKDISELFLQALPLLEDTLTDALAHKESPKPLRIPVSHRSCWKRQRLDDSEDGESKSVFVPPQVGEFQPPASVGPTNTGVSLRDRPLQVIVKIASMELEAGESYPGGTWHVEGALDERIVATACCYLESTNVTGGDLHFRVAIQEPDFVGLHGDEGDPFKDLRGIKSLYGIKEDHQLVQNIGQCSTRAGRILAWPNTLQHAVSPVELEDEDQPGKRTICCFFLVDPTLRIRSTATVPPQQMPWYSSRVKQVIHDAGLIPEKGLCDTIASFVPYPEGMLTYEEACERRDRLMAERTASTAYSDGAGFYRTFSFCEH